MRLLITGGAGFIGTNAALHFLPTSKEIVILDNFSRKTAIKNALFLRKQSKKIKIIQGDVRNINDLVPIVKKADVVLHLAGQVAVTTSLQNPRDDFECNVLGSFNVLEAARKYNPKAILIYSSTNKVYGNMSARPLHVKRGISETQPVDFYSPYGCSKGAADLYFQDYHRSFNLNTVVFRQSCIYGQHQYGVEDQGWLAYFAIRFLNKKPITLYGNGKQIRDVLFVDDLISAYHLTIDKISKVNGEILNIGGGEKNAVSLLSALDLLKANLGYMVSIRHAPKRLGDQDYFVSDNSKIESMLKWRPTVSYTVGLDKLLQWLRATI